MHIAHLIAVEADSAEEAIAEVDNVLSPYGKGQVWDWYSVGGRWDGMLEGGNVLRYSDNPEAFRTDVENVLKHRNRAFMALQAKLTGKTVTAEDIDDASMGLPVKDKEGAAERISAANKGVRKEVGRLLEAPSLKEARKALHSFMGAYHLGQFAKFIMGNYMFDSKFFDGVDHTTDDGCLWERCEEEPEMQWLVLVDLHN